MADPAELDSRIARLEAALTATADALDAALETPADGDALKAVQDDLAVARQTIETMAEQIKDREQALDAALARAQSAETKLAEAPVATGDGGDGADSAALRARITELQAARAQDLAEMKSLLAELEPMLETADA